MLSEWPKTVQKLVTKHPKIKQVIPGHDNWKVTGHIENTFKLFRKEIKLNTIAAHQNSQKDLGYRFPAEWEEHESNMVVLAAQEILARSYSVNLSSLC